MNYSTYNKSYQEEPKMNVEANIPIHDIQLYADQWEQLRLQYKLIIVKVWAPWCLPCEKAGQKLNILIQELMQMYPSLHSHILYLHDNIEDPNTIHKEKINVIPYFFVYQTLNPSESTLIDTFTNVDFEAFRQRVHQICQHIVHSSSGNQVQYFVPHEIQKKTV